MKIRNKKTFKCLVCLTTFIGMIFLLSGYDKVRPTTAPFVGSMVEPFKDKGVHIRAKAFTPQESKRYLNRNLQKWGYQPVQLTIQNNSGDTYFLSSEGVDLPTSGSSDVAMSVWRSTIPRSIALKVAGFLFWPFMIPSTIDSILTFKTHLELRGDLHAKSIKDEEELLLPYSTVHRVIFVPMEKFSDVFTLHLQEEKNQTSHPFPIKIDSLEKKA